MARVKNHYDILIIEDEQEIADIIRTYLKIYHLFSKIVIADSSQQASQKLINQSFDLIITDMQLGSRSAIEFIKKIKLNPKYSKIKVMVVSGCLTQDDTLALMRLGIRNILVKPFTARQILMNAISCLRIEKRPQATVDLLIKSVREKLYDQKERIDNSVPDDALSNMIRNSKTNK